MNLVARTLLFSALLASAAGCSGDDDSGPGATGVSRSEAGCRPIVTEDFVPPPSGSHHVPQGQEVPYDSPPAAALHWDSFPTGPDLKNLYRAEDRPPVPDIVHLTEHGYNIVWYDDTIADDESAMGALESIADDYPLGDYLVVSPWTADDGPAFPDEAHVALTHWTGPSNMQGVWEYCAKVSAEVVDEFTATYTKANSPEPTAP